MVSYLAAQPVYDFLSAKENSAIHYREGPHDQLPEDFRALLAARLREPAVPSLRAEDYLERWALNQPKRQTAGEYRVDTSAVR
ncbi:MAG: hypothetical protein HY706_16925 [Candidatus Hydrogenedentes bacterium]|nr:hypothetical protein [Candidatus Hydrogenedentota bacterium]